MDRAKARSITRRVQAIAAVFVLGAAVAAFAPLGATHAEAPDPADASPVAAKPPEPAAPAVEIDTTMLAAAINAVAGPVKNQPVPVEPVAPEQPVAAAPAGLDAWRYLGAIMSSSYKRAIVTVGEKQQLLAEGQRIGEIEIVQIDKQFIKVKQGEVETTIDLAPRQRPALTLLDPASVAARNNANAHPGARSVSPGAQPGMTLQNGDPSAAARAQRNAERFKEARARGDDKAAAQFDPDSEEAAKYEKLEKGEKGSK
ncbi:MAG: hypothetical protein Q8L55_07920 [Phycisphaerales bacterium]|nr:hypothetical protein [Phycisphaerales bacterium]